MAPIVAVIAATRAEFKRWVNLEHPDYALLAPSEIIATPPRGKRQRVEYRYFGKLDDLPPGLVLTGILVVGSYWVRMGNTKLIDRCYMQLGGTDDDS